MALDPITAGLLSQFSKEFEISGLPEDKRFEHLCAYLAVSRHYGQVFDTDDVLMGTAFGIDGIAIVVNGSLIVDAGELRELAEASDYLEALFIFVQADRSGSFELGKIGNFGVAVQDAFRNQPEFPRNAEVSRAAEVFAEIYAQSSKLKRGNPVCRLYFFTPTPSRVTDDRNVEARRAGVEDDVRSLDLFSEVKLELLGRREIQELYRQTTNAISRQFQFLSNISVPDIEGVKEAYVGLLPAPTLVSILTAEGGEMLTSIFYDNVRDWQGDTPVNREMAATLQAADGRPRFALMNNGITIISRNLQRTSQRFEIQDFQVVNGCQTCHVLFNSREELDESVMVPVRLIVTEDEDITSAIIRATNRQTEVKDEQFFAITTFAKELEQYFATFQMPHKLYYERRPKQYDRLPIEKTRIINQDILLRSFAAIYLNEPHAVTRSTKRLREKIGREAFVDGHKLIPYYTAAYAAYLLERRFRNNQLPREFKPARFHILLATRIIANSEPLPPMNSNEIERRCTELQGMLWDVEKADDLFGQAIEMVSSVAKGNLDRDTIRTLPFTRALLECLGQRPSELS